MRRILRIAAVVIGVLLLVVSVVAVSLYLASQSVPDFYAEALALDEAAARQGSRELLDRATTLTSTARRDGRWQTVFTEDQLNGWLAVDRVKNHPDLLPAEFSDPRVAIGPKSATIGCRYEDGGVSSVLSIEVDLFMSEPNVVAVRIRRAWAGAVPMPLTQVLAGISALMPLEWSQIEGDPVALITIEPAHDGDGVNTTLTLETLELRQDEVHVAGRTERVAGKR